MEYGIDEYGYYKYPPRPTELPEENEYPRKYSLRTFTKEEINKDRYNSSIRGYTLNRQTKGDVNFLTEDGTLETKQGWIPGASGLIFRCLQLGLIKIGGWCVVERNTGISLMPPVESDPEPDPITELIEQLTFDFTNPEPEPVKIEKQTGYSRKQAIELATRYVETFTDEQWIELQKQLNYDLAGISYENILTPEQQALEEAWSEGISKINIANDLKRATNNFFNCYKPLRIHQDAPRPKMGRKKNSVRITEKLNPKIRTKFYVNQEEYSNTIEVEGVVLAIDIDGIDLIKEIVIVKGDQFKNSVLEEKYAQAKYYPFEPYMGLGTGRSSKTQKEAIASIKERFETTDRSTELVESINNRYRLHQERIIAAQTGEGTEKFIGKEV